MNTGKLSRKLSIGTLFAFGAGQAAEGIKNQAFNVFLLFYYQQVVGVSGTLTGLALAIALVFDAITDPMAGLLSDRFNSRFGRRHPFMFVSAFPLALCFILLFNPPELGGEFSYFIWITVFAVLVRGSLTFYYVPHLALGAEMAHDYTQRSTLFAFSTVFSITGMALVGVMGYRLFFPTTAEFSPGTLNPDGYFAFSLTFAAMMFGVIMWCCFGTAKEIPHLRKAQVLAPLTPRAIVRDFADVFANPSFRLIFIGMLLSTFAIAVEAIFSPFMGLHFWGIPTEDLAKISLATLIGIWIGLPLAGPLTRLLDKRLALVVPAVIVVVNANLITCLRLLDVSWFPDNDSPWIFWLYGLKYLIQGICLPILFATFNSMFADIADEVELDTGFRREGVIYSTRSFSTKVASALGALLGGVLLDAIAFPKGAVVGSVAPETIWYLGLIEGPVTSFVSLAGVLFYLRYRITRKRHAEIAEQLASRRSL